MVDATASTIPSRTWPESASTMQRHRPDQRGHDQHRAGPEGDLPGGQHLRLGQPGHRRVQGRRAPAHVHEQPADVGDRALAQRPAGRLQPVQDVGEHGEQGRRDEQEHRDGTAAGGEQPDHGGEQQPVAEDVGQHRRIGDHQEVRHGRADHGQVDQQQQDQGDGDGVGQAGLLDPAAAGAGEAQLRGRRSPRTSPGRTCSICRAARPARPPGPGCRARRRPSETRIAPASTTHGQPATGPVQPDPEQDGAGGQHGHGGPGDGAPEHVRHG